MKENNAIEVSNVSKSFRIYMDRSYTLMESLLFWKRKRYENREVLKNISFEVRKGEAIGLIGHNGCGKSTMLKLLSKILYPDSGSIKINGRVSSLIELGAGFHPDMSGRENIYINASIFGLTKKEIDKRLDDIIEFSELGEYIDNPVRTYSSGMYMRLAFSVAINVDADILLIDEILAVGDAKFQTKCFNKLREIKAKGTTIVIVSHSMGQIEQICDRSIWINEGIIRMDGVPQKVHLEYLDFLMNPQKEEIIQNIETEVVEKKVNKEEINKKQEIGNKKIEILNAEIMPPNKKTYRSGEEFCIEISYRRNDMSIKEAILGFNVIRSDGVFCYGTNTFVDKCGNLIFKDENEGKVSIEIKNIMLLQGKYDMDIAFSDGISTNYHYVYKAIQFEVSNLYDELGTSRVEHCWKLN